MRRRAAVEARGPRAAAAGRREAARAVRAPRVQGLAERNSRGEASAGARRRRSAAGLSSRRDPLQPSPLAAADRHYETVLTEAQLEAWLARNSAAPLVCVDTETTSLDPMTAQLVGISLSVEPGNAAYIPVAHSYAGAPAQLSRWTRCWRR